MLAVHGEGSPVTGTHATEVSCWHVSRDRMLAMHDEGSPVTGMQLSRASGMCHETACLQNICIYYIRIYNICIY